MSGDPTRGGLILQYRHSQLWKFQARLVRGNSVYFPYCHSLLCSLEQLQDKLHSWILLYHPRHFSRISSDALNKLPLLFGGNSASCHILTVASFVPPLPLYAPLLSTHLPFLRSTITVPPHISVVPPMCHQIYPHPRKIFVVPWDVIL